MISRKYFQILIAIAITMCCLSSQSAAQIPMTAKHLKATADSLISTYASYPNLAGVSASDIDTNGYANKWIYNYYSFDSSNINHSTYYAFNCQNNQVTFLASSWMDAVGDSMFLVNGWVYISNGWMDSDSALLIAQRVMGSALRKQFPAYTIWAKLIPEHYFKLHAVWQIGYSCEDGNTRAVEINAITGDTVRIYLTTSVNNTSNQLLPIRFELNQNIPNPFNPTTNISFSISGRSYVSLKIFDLLGREVASLVSEELSTGYYSRRWNASKFANGIYFYRLQAGLYSETKKLILLK